MGRTPPSAADSLRKAFRGSTIGGATQAARGAAMKEYSSEDSTAAAPPPPPVAPKREEDYGTRIRNSVRGIAKFFGDLHKPKF